MRILAIALALFIGLSPDLSAKDDPTRTIKVFKSSECSCCKRWVKYLESKNYNVTVVNTRNVLAEKARLGVPPEAAACHTAEIDGYVVEGHVTDRDIQRMLLFRPKIIGIAVPGMPIGTPGMEDGDTRVPHNVLSFDKDGKIEVFKKH